MKYLSFLLVVLSLVALAGCDPGADRIIKRAPDWPGYMVADQCFPFALAANEWLRSENVETHVICFHYTSVYGQAQRDGGIAVLEGGGKIYHAVVMYKDRDGWFAFDNIHTMPTWVDTLHGNHSWLRRVQVMYPTAYEINATPANPFHAEPTSTPFPGGQR